jgi:hypothetical protein
MRGDGVIGSDDIALLIGKRLCLRELCRLVESVVDRFMSGEEALRRTPLHRRRDMTHDTGQQPSCDCPPSERLRASAYDKLMPVKMTSAAHLQSEVGVTRVSETDSALERNRRRGDALDPAVL